MKFFVSKRMSKKNNTYLALFCDLGNRVITVTFDKLILSQITNLSIRELEDLAIGEVIDVK